MPFKRHFQRVSCVEAAETASERLVRFTRARLYLHLNVVWFGGWQEVESESVDCIEEKTTYKKARLRLVSSS